MSHDMQIVSAGAARSSVGVVPVARVPIAIRVATLADLPALDALQKKYNKALGYFPTKQFEGYIAMGGVLVAEEGAGETDRLGLGLGLGLGPDEANHNLNPNRNLNRPSPPLLGYVISRDRYLKRDELGVIYQLCVAPGAQRKLVGATLVKEVFTRSAYGCRLYCCWCAQDLEANHFWESLGFVPIAFRAGGKGRARPERAPASRRARPERATASRRVHIFWQRRICDGDNETRWWYPSQTNSGAIREDRLVFPIPPGTHWSEVRAVALPQTENPKLECRDPKQIRNPKSKIQNPPGPPPGKVAIVVGGRIRYVDRPGYVATEAQRAIELPSKAKAPRPAHEPRAKVKLDPKYVAAARELRDRWMEHVNTTPLLPAGKYDVSRALAGPVVDRPSPARRSTPALPAPLAA